MRLITTGMLMLSSNLSESPVTTFRTRCGIASSRYLGFLKFQSQNFQGRHKSRGHPGLRCQNCIWSTQSASMSREYGQGKKISPYLICNSRNSGRRLYSRRVWKFNCRWYPFGTVSPIWAASKSIPSLVSRQTFENYQTLPWSLALGKREHYFYHRI